MPASRAARTSTTAFMERLERSETLGRAADEMAKPVGALLGDGPVSDALRGRPLAAYGSAPCAASSRAAASTSTPSS